MKGRDEDVLLWMKRKCGWEGWLTYDLGKKPYMEMDSPVIGDTRPKVLNMLNCPGHSQNMVEGACMN